MSAFIILTKVIATVYTLVASVAFLTMSHLVVDRDRREALAINVAQGLLLGLVVVAIWL